jgi:ureidoacrylate peracid hydrolase
MHKVNIFPEVLERVMRWRGRRHVYDAFEASRAALVVVDMQNAWVMEGQPAYGAINRTIVPNINRLATALRSAGGAVAWVKMCTSPEAMASWGRFHDFIVDPGLRARWTAALTEGNVGFDLWHELDVQPGDDIVVKTRYSALVQGASDLEARLRKRGIETVIITGTATNTCCEATARDANMLNFKTVVVSDATTARSDAEHNAALSSLFNLFADVMTTQEVIERAEASAGLAADVSGHDRLRHRAG